MSGSVADDLLRSYYERWQRLEEEKARAAEDLKQLFIEAKGNGLIPKAMRAAFRDKAKVETEDQADRLERQEFEAVVELYRASLDAPRAHPAPAHEKTLKNFHSDGSAFAAVKAQGRLANAAGVEPLPSEPTTHPDPHSPRLTAGSLHPSSDAAGAKSDGVPPFAGQGGHEPDISCSKSEHQDGSAAQDRNEPVSASGPTATPFHHKPYKLRPHCQHPEECAGYGTKHCHGCLTARDEAIVAGEVAA